MLTAQLAHDVGKYLARTARNLPIEGAVDAELLAMLCRDLYGDARSAAPSVRFAAIAVELEPLAADARLGQARALLDELGRREAAVRAGQPQAVRQAAALALQIEQLLREMAAQSSAPRRRRAQGEFP